MSAKRQTIAALLATAGYTYERAVIVGPTVDGNTARATAVVTARETPDVANKLAKDLAALGWAVSGAETLLTLAREIGVPISAGMKREQIVAALQEAADADI